MLELSSITHKLFPYFINMNMFDFRQLFVNFQNNTFKKYKDIFDQLKMFLKIRLIDYEENQSW